MTDEHPPLMRQALFFGGPLAGKMRAIVPRLVHVHHQLARVFFDRHAEDRVESEPVETTTYERVGELGGALKLMVYAETGSRELEALLSPGGLKIVAQTINSCRSQ